MCFACILQTTNKLNYRPNYILRKFLQKTSENYPFIMLVVSYDCYLEIMENETSVVTFPAFGKSM